MRVLPFCFQTHIILGGKKNKLVERILYIFHTIVGGFWQLDPEKHKTVWLVSNGNLLHTELRIRVPFSPESPRLIHQTCPWKIHSFFFLQDSDAVDTKKFYCCYCAYSGDNIKSFDDSRNDILDILYIETEVYNLESAIDRDSVCFFSHFALFLGTVVWLKAHTSSASNRPPELILIITMAQNQTPIPFSLVLCEVSKALHQWHVRELGCSLLRDLFQCLENK